MEREKGFEPSTLALARRCSTAELFPQALSESSLANAGGYRGNRRGVSRGWKVVSSAPCGTTSEKARRRGNTRGRWGESGPAALRGVASRAGAAAGAAARHPALP